MFGNISKRKVNSTTDRFTRLAEFVVIVLLRIASHYQQAAGLQHEFAALATAQMLKTKAPDAAQ